MGRVFAQASTTDIIKPSILAVSIILFLLFLFVAYGPKSSLWPKQDTVPWRQTLSFGFGCLVLYLSFGGPLDYLSDNYLFSVHMVQHMAEIVVMTPLFVYGTPQWLLAPLLRVRVLQKIFKFWLHPLVASVVSNGVIDLFHLPALYDLALQYDSFHFFEHLCFFIVSIFLWLARRPLTPGEQLVYFVFNYNLMMPIVVFMLIAQHPWYTFYVTQPRIYPWLTPLVDQQLGAFVMAEAMMGAYVCDFRYSCLLATG